MNLEVFHSLTITPYDWSSIQRFKRSICVDLPEPSVPSITINKPSYPCFDLYCVIYKIIPFWVNIF